MSKTQKALETAESIIDDIEFSRLGPSQILLKCARLTRLLENEEKNDWIYYEINGYGNNASEKHRVNMEKSGRITPSSQRKDEESWFTQPLSNIVSVVETQKLKLARMGVPNFSGDYVAIAHRNHLDSMNATGREISRMEAISSRVVSRMYDFASTCFNELVFSQEQHSLFEQARLDVDSQLSTMSTEALNKVSSISSRLREGDSEAVSQAMTTCRRMIDTFADSVYPAQKEPIIIDDQEMQVTHSHTRNRIYAYLHETNASKGHKKRLKRAISDTYERVSKAVHDEIDTVEARFLFLNTYIILGEISQLNCAKQTSASGDSSSS